MKCLRIFLLILTSAESLNKFLKHYERLNYQPTDQNRVSRSADEIIRLSFHAYGRDFKLIVGIVNENDSVFLENATFKYVNETVQIKWENDIVKGIVDGDDNSHVSGSIRNGIFEGVIEMSNGEEFWIESSYPYNSTSPFHSFIYSANEVEMPEPAERTKRYDFPNPFSNEDHYRNSIHTAIPQMKTASKLRPFEICRKEVMGDKLNHRASRFEKPHVKPPKRTKKRRTHHESVDENGIWGNRICSMQFTIDHTLYEYVFNGAGRGDDTETRRELRRMMQIQLNRVNEIYQQIDFGGIKGIHFKVAGFTIWKNANEIANPFAKDTTDHNLFLDWHAAGKKHNESCLSYVFTYRDFDQQTLGLAFTCYVCANWEWTNGKEKAHNTGMVTFKNNGNEIPERQRHLTLAHEIGHSLGSNHDQSPLTSGKLESEVYPECDSDGTKGGFIMRAHANDGSKRNHKYLSPCSIRNITRNLKRLLAIKPQSENGRQTNCFIESTTPICGNGEIEDGEECDCGYNQKECDDARDQCCWPGDKPNKCKLKNPEYKCSPSQGNCCTEACLFKGSHKICSPDLDCTSKTYCLAESAKCPPSNPINDGYPCDDATGVCNSGECKGNICSAEGLEECEPSKDTCVRHCNFKGSCTSTADIEQFSHRNYSQKGRWGHPGLLKKANENCKNDKGLCDDIGVCRDMVNGDTLAESRVEHGIKTLGEFLEENWWLLIIVVIAGIIILAFCILLCYYKMPKLSLRSPRETDTTTHTQMTVKAHSKTLKQKPSVQSLRVKPVTPDASKVSGTVAPSTMTGQWIIPESKEKTKIEK